jgi:type II secretory pathway pseudopilin PulG
VRSEITVLIWSTSCRGVYVKRLTNRFGPAERDRYNAFTLIELVVVIATIAVLAGLVLATSGYVVNKGKRSRAEAEIAAISAALENYRVDNAIYPRSTVSDSLNARSNYDSSNYQVACADLYAQLTGDSDYDDVPEAGTKTYMAFKPNMKGLPDNSQPPSATNKAFIKDPFGNSYGYSTACQNDPATGYNPTFDLWSIANAKPPGDQNQWIKNW